MKHKLIDTDTICRCSYANNQKKTLNFFVIKGIIFPRALRHKLKGLCLLGFLSRIDGKTFFLLLLLLLLQGKTKVNFNERLKNFTTPHQNMEHSSLSLIIKYISRRNEKFKLRKGLKCLTFDEDLFRQQSNFLISMIFDKKLPSRNNYWK